VMTPTMSLTFGRSAPWKTMAAPARWRFNLASTRL
jgi:hypothetical protein